MPAIRKTISFDEDPEILEWVAAQDNLSESVRLLIKDALGAARREDTQEQGPTLEQVYAKLLEMEQTLANLRLAGDYDGDAPGTEQAASALDRLGL